MRLQGSYMTVSDANTHPAIEDHLHGEAMIGLRADFYDKT
jgi:hypothetical protein